MKLRSLDFGGLYTSFFQWGNARFVFYAILDLPVSCSSSENFNAVGRQSIDNFGKTYQIHLLKTGSPGQKKGSAYK